MMNGDGKDPNRINSILHLFRVIWELNSDMRFFQLIDSLKHEYSTENNEFGMRGGIEIDSNGYSSISYIDLFYLQDERLEEFLHDFIDKTDNRR